MVFHCSGSSLGFLSFSLNFHWLKRDVVAEQNVLESVGWTCIGLQFPHGPTFLFTSLFTWVSMHFLSLLSFYFVFVNML